MADRRLILVLLLLMMTAGCATPVSEQPRPEESEAQRHLSRAELFEKTAAFEAAAVEYTFVAENYPSTPYYSEAVRKAALLYSMPSNPTADQASALRWLRAYLTLPLPEEEKRDVELHVALLQQVQSLKDSIAREKNSRQKLLELATRRGKDLHELAKRIQELETELQKATQELEELKAVDVQTSGIKAKK